MTRFTMLGALLVMGATSLQAQSSDNPGASGGVGGAGTTGSVGGSFVPPPSGSGSGSGSGAGAGGGSPTVQPPSAGVSAANAAVGGGGGQQGGGQQGAGAPSGTVSVNSDVPGVGPVSVPAGQVNLLTSTLTTGSPASSGGLANALRGNSNPSDNAAELFRGPSVSASASDRQDPAGALANSLAAFADGITIDELKAATAAYNAFVTSVVRAPGNDFGANSGPSAGRDDRATVPPITYVIRKTLKNLSVYAK